MTCTELMNKIIDEEYLNQTEFSKNFDRSCASRDKLTAINLLVDHFHCDFEEAHHVCEYFIDQIPLPSDLTPQQIQKVNQEAQDLLCKPTCPTCGSTNVQHISGLERGASIFGFGVFSRKLNKTYKCLNCKYMW